MASVSQLVITNPDINSFAELEALVIEAAKQGEIFLELDIKPDFPDTPRKWVLRLEAAFYRGEQPDKTGAK